MLVSSPTSCHLWHIDSLPEQEFRAALENVESIANESHVMKDLYRCRTCGQRYFGIWYELVDWTSGDDQTYEICVPIATDLEIAQLTHLVPPPMSLDVLAIAPRLQFDAAGPERRVRWVREKASH